MILVLALTQFAFLVLGVVFLKILVNAMGAAAPAYVLSLNAVAIWLLVIPPIWVFFASVCLRGPSADKLVRASGAVVAVLCFLFLAAVAYFFPG